MNYITSCPKCDTQFILTKEHIKSYRGKVQCGSCEHVFNAKNRLTEISDDIHSEEDYLASLEEDTIVEEDLRKEEPATSVTDDIDISDLIIDTEADQTPYIGDTPPAEILDETPTIPTADKDYYVAEPAFLQKKEVKKQNNTWLTFLSVLLLITAALQAIYYMRTQIASEYPQFKPMLVQACTQLKCKIDLPRNLDFITINDSDMQESDDYESVVNFSTVIINNAKYTQAYPNIKLTLTDANDDAVIKKLIYPKEYVKTAKAIKNGFVSGKELNIELVIGIKEVPVAGYQVQLIY